MSAPDEDRLARVALSRVVEPGSRAVARALERMPAAAVWEDLRRGVALQHLGQQALEGITVRAQGYDPRRDLERVLALGGRVVVPGDAEWPQCCAWPVEAMAGSDVREMAAPWALYVRGLHDLGEVSRGAVAVVGARAATAYGTHVAGELAFGVAEAGLPVVSGGAYGIDAAAHQGALAAAAAPTVAVLACGVDVAYPRQHERLLARIVEQGLLVSEVPPGSSVTRVRFLVRNRLIAALARGTVVVEAAHRSGSLSTAARANDLQRVVMAVPGPVTSALSAGCHDWIRSARAALVTTAADVLELVGAAGEHLVGKPVARSDPRDGLSETVRRVLDAVPVRTPVGVAQLARTAGVSALVVQQVLPGLLMAGLVQQVDGAWRLTALGAGSPAS
ncbi:MAG TPA: DNA-processing protein DprA [Mycobacteriales bacterium]|nr:DNA-processing protein DprA [Mycobacteriales bacterium]